MKIMVFNGIVLGLAVAGLIGWLFSGSELFLAGLIIFGVWSLVNLVEHFVRKRIKDEPIKMVKE